MRHAQRFRALYLFSLTFILPSLLYFGLVIWMRQNYGAGLLYDLVLTIVIVLSVPALLFLIVFGPIAIHELGHLLGGWAGRFQILVFAVGPLLFYRVGGKMATAFVPGWLELQGWVWALPRDSAALRNRMILFLAAGPFASGLGGLLLLLKNPFLGVLGFMSLFGVLSLIPLKGGLGSDGWQMIQLLRRQRSPSLGADWFDLFESEVPPADWPMAVFIAQALISKGTHREGRANLYAYYMALEKGRPSLARRFIEQAAELVGEMRFERIYEELAFMAASKGDVITARAALDRAHGVGTPYYLRAESLLASVEGDHPSAFRLREQAEIAFSRVVYPPGLHRLEANMLSRLDDYLPKDLPSLEI